MPTESEVRDFKTILKLMRLSDSNFHYYNHHPWQTKLVFDNLLDYAVESLKSTVEEQGQKPEFCIFSSDLDLDFIEGEVFTGRLIELAKSGCCIRIVLAAKPVNQRHNEVWLELSRHLVEYQSPAIRYMREYSNQSNHLWVFGNAYRFEKAHELNAGFFTFDKRPDRPARFAFNEPGVAKAIREYFEAVTSESVLLN